MYKDIEKKRLAEKRYRENNKEKMKLYWRQRGKKRAAENKRTRLVKRYNLTTEQFNKMLDDQNHQCWICKKHETLFKKGLMIDHNHTTNKVRKLLCPNCNAAIGHFFEDVSVMERAIIYIKETAN